MDWVYEKVGGEEEEVGAAEAGQQVVEDACHGPGDSIGGGYGLTKVNFVHVYPQIPLLWSNIRLLT